MSRVVIGAMHTEPHGHRLRTGRVTLRSAVYLLTTVTALRRPLFHDNAIAELTATALKHYHQRAYIHCFAWVIMPDHVHWLLQLRVGSLDWLMRAFKSWTARQIRVLAGMPGRRIWQAGYHDRHVRPHERLLPYASYVVLNPVRARLVVEFDQYPWYWWDPDLMDEPDRAGRRPY